jgi:SAM-dependent methyltransferase
MPRQRLEEVSLSYFDHFAGQTTTRAGRWIKRHARERQVARILPLLPDRRSAVLEIGPGFGELADSFRRAGYHNYTVVEPNASMRERLMQRGIRAKGYLIPRLDEPDQAYDAIVLFAVFEHFNGNQDAQLFMAEARRALRPRGLLCLLAPDYLHWGRDFYNVDYTHNNVTTVRRVSQLFQDNGFRLVDRVYFSGFFSGPAATLISSLVRCGLFFSSGDHLSDRLYRLKTSFLRSFLIVGRLEV